MLNGIHLVDFGNHRDTQLTFGKMTALVGQNGAGKTSVLQGVLEVNQASLLKADESSPLGAKGKIRKGANVATVATSWPGQYKGIEGDFGVLFNIDGSQIKSHCQWHPKESSKLWIPISPSQISSSSFARLRESVKTASPFIGDVQDLDQVQWGNVGCPSVRYFKAAGSKLRGASYSETMPPSLGEEGSELAWTLAYLRNARPKQFSEILDAIKKVVPAVIDIRAQPASVVRVERKVVTINRQDRTYDDAQQVMGQELLFDMVSGEELPAKAISEGTLLVLAILTLLHSDETPDVVLLDDVELGLHPRAQRDLVQQLRRLQVARPNLQIIFSSHSPYIIDELEPEDVWILAPDQVGLAHSARLSEHPDAKRALEVLTTGEFWSAEGEDWVLDPERRRNEQNSTT